MNREEKLKLSAEAEIGHAFRQGLFAKLYEQSLWRFVHQVKPLKPMLEQVKSGPPVVYGGLPVKSFEALLSENKLPGADQREYGWRWPTESWPEASVDFKSWRSGIVEEAKEPPVQAINGRDVLREILEYDLAGSTPLQAMLAISGWREYLQTIDRAG